MSESLRKPLYLEPKTLLGHDGETPEIWVVVEGPALCVRWQGRPESYYPLRRISRIVASEKVQFHTSALLACAQRDIPILIHDEGFQHSVRMVGSRPHDTFLRQRLLDFQERPDWQERFGDWYNAMKRRIDQILARRLQAPSSCLSSPDGVRRWIENQIRALAGEPVREKTAQCFWQLNLAWMQSRLLEHGIDASSEHWLYDDIDLGMDLARLLDHRTQTIRIGWLRRRKQWAQQRQRPLKPVDKAQLIRVYERDAARIGRLGDDIINRLHRWLVSMQ